MYQYQYPSSNTTYGHPTSSSTSANWSMAPSWDAFQILEIGELIGKHHCEGYAPSKQRRCHNPINKGDRATANDMLHAISKLNPQSPDLSSHLQKLAYIMLCNHCHRKWDLAIGVAEIWYWKIQLATDALTGNQLIEVQRLLNAHNNKMGYHQEEFTYKASMTYSTTSAFRYGNTTRQSSSYYAPEPSTPQKQVQKQDSEVVAASSSFARKKSQTPRPVLLETKAAKTKNGANETTVPRGDTRSTFGNPLTNAAPIQCSSRSGVQTAFGKVSPESMVKAEILQPAKMSPTKESALKNSPHGTAVLQNNSKASQDTSETQIKSEITQEIKIRVKEASGTASRPKFPSEILREAVLKLPEVFKGTEIEPVAIKSEELRDGAPSLFASPPLFSSAQQPNPKPVENHYPSNDIRSYTKFKFSFACPPEDPTNNGNSKGIDDRNLEAQRSPKEKLASSPDRSLSSYVSSTLTKLEAGTSEISLNVQLSSSILPHQAHQWQRTLLSLVHNHPPTSPPIQSPSISTSIDPELLRLLYFYLVHRPRLLSLRFLEAPAPATLATCGFPPEANEQDRPIQAKAKEKGQRRGFWHRFFAFTLYTAKQASLKVLNGLVHRMLEVSGRGNRRRIADIEAADEHVTATENEGGPEGGATTASPSELPSSSWQIFHWMVGKMERVRQWTKEQFNRVFGTIK